MVGEAAFIAGDWGTTNARFWLCDPDGEVLATGAGPGVAPLRGSGRFGEEFANVTADWPVGLPAVLCGTIGANIGWRQAECRELPAPLDRGGERALRFEEQGRQIAILAGVTGCNTLGQPDLMRGEETQLSGVYSVGGDGLYVLPGTHNKWVMIANGAISAFHTAMTGELYAAISNGTILLTSKATLPQLGNAFDSGVRLALEHGEAGIAALLFTVRTRQVLGHMPETDAASYLSGIMIGSDVAGGLALFGDAASKRSVTLVGGAELAATYARALELGGCNSQRIAGEDAVRIGLTQAWRQIFAG
jgi:2-dehydro-3-deoxygalactonokinase